jgi:hypothetical protein
MNILCYCSGKTFLLNFAFVEGFGLQNFGVENQDPPGVELDTKSERKTYPGYYPQDNEKHFLYS